MIFEIPKVRLWLSGKRSDSGGQGAPAGSTEVEWHGSGRDENGICTVDFFSLERENMASQRRRELGKDSERGQGHEAETAIIEEGHRGRDDEVIEGDAVECILLNGLETFVESDGMEIGNIAYGISADGPDA